MPNTDHFPDGFSKLTEHMAFKLAIFLLVLFFGVIAMAAPSPAIQHLPDALPKTAPTQGHVPGGALGNSSQAEFWRAIRKNVQGTVSLPDKKAGVLVQAGGETWRQSRNRTLSFWGGWAFGGMIALLCLFYLIKGKILIEHGPSGEVVERFTLPERTAHWVLAISFIVLALTGFNILYGKHILLPLIGAPVFAATTYYGKLAHNYLGFVFMAALIWVFVQWVRENILDRYDIPWLLKGGGLIVGSVHPPARKFNFGQKIIFWLVVLGGLSLSLSGLALMWPFEVAMFSHTFAFLNLFGLDLPTNLAAVEEMQYAQLWHGIMAVFLTVVILAHIYIGTVGMEGAFGAMGRGKVDLNWAKEHHAVWVDMLKPDKAQPRKPPLADRQDGGVQPAE